MTGFDPLIRVLGSEGFLLCGTCYFLSCLGGCWPRTADKNHAGGRGKRNLLFSVYSKRDGGVNTIETYERRNARRAAGDAGPRRATGGLGRSARTNQPVGL